MNCRIIIINSKYRVWANLRKKNREVYVKIIRRFSSVKNTTLYFKIMYKSVNDKSGSSEKGKEIVYKFALHKEYIHRFQIKSEI